MVKPANGGLSAWNSFVRVYDAQFNVPKYSSLVVGVWDTLTQAGGGNTDLYGVFKTNQGVICVGRQTADTSGNPNGNNIPVTNITPWGSATPQNESAILVYYKATNLINSNDSTIHTTGVNQPEQLSPSEDILLFPNPAQQTIVVFLNSINRQPVLYYKIVDMFGRVVKYEAFTDTEINISDLSNGVYQFQLESKTYHIGKKFIIVK